MDWLNTIVTAFVALVGTFGGGSIVYWRATRKTKDAEANKTTTEARLAEADFAEKILQKYEQGILARMDAGDAVRSKEFNELTAKIEKRFDRMESENKSQNSLLADIVEFLNGDFQQFEKKKGKNHASND